MTSSATMYRDCTLKFHPEFLISSAETVDHVVGRFRGFTLQRTKNVNTKKIGAILLCTFTHHKQEVATH